MGNISRISIQMAVRFKNQIRAVKGIALISNQAIAMCCLGLLFYCYEYYLRVSPGVMKSELKLFYGISEAAFGNLAACYYYGYTPLQMPAGILMDKYGPRKILISACLGCALGALLFANTASVGWAQIGRFSIGVGSAFAYVGVLKLSSLWLPKRYYSFMAGICTALGLMGGMMGLMTLTVMMKFFGWQMTLKIAACIGLVLSCVLWFCLKEKEPTVKPKAKILDNDKLAHVITGFTSFKQMLCSPQMWLNGLIGCITFLPISVFAELWAMPYLESWGLSKEVAANASSIGFLGFAIGGPIWGIISDRLQKRRLLLCWGPLIAAIFMGLLLYVPSQSVAWAYFTIFFTSFFAAVEVLVFAVSHDLSDNKVIATGAAFTNTIVMLGGALLQPLVGLFVDYLTHHAEVIEMSVPQSLYVKALSLIPVLLVLGSLASLLLKETYPAQIDD